MLRTQTSPLDRTCSSPLLGHRAGTSASGSSPRAAADEEPRWPCGRPGSQVYVRGPSTSRSDGRSEGHRIVGCLEGAAMTSSRCCSQSLVVPAHGPRPMPASCSTSLPVVRCGRVRAAPARDGFLLDGRIHNRGAIGVMLGGHVEVTTLTSPACRPVGPVRDGDGRGGASCCSSRWPSGPAALRAQDRGCSRQPDRALAPRKHATRVAVDSEDPRMGIS